MTGEQYELSSKGSRGFYPGEAAVSFGRLRRSSSQVHDPKRTMTCASCTGGLFDPMGMSKNEASYKEAKQKEIKNGRLVGGAH